MKKRFITQLTLIVAILSLTAVSEEKPLSLNDTKWKLVGFVDAETGVLEEPDYSMYGSSGDPYPTPPDLSTDDWYTLQFEPIRTDSNYCLNGCQYFNVKLTYWHIYGGSFVVDYVNYTIDLGGIEWVSMLDAPGGERFRTALRGSHKFERTDTSLKIYYLPDQQLDYETWEIIWSGDLKYLLFKPWEPAPSKVQDAARIVRQPNSDKEAQAAVLPPEILLSPTAFTAGPNPIAKSAAQVNFFRVGKQVKSAALKVYDASSKAVCGIDIKDAGQSKKRQVGSWNLRDAKGRPVPEGTYLVKGTLMTVDRKSERIGLLIGVR
jgi:hypothetical protein